MNTLRRFLPCLPLLSVPGEKSYSTTIWASGKTGRTVTPEEVKKASQQPK